MFVRRKNVKQCRKWSNECSNFWESLVKKSNMVHVLPQKKWLWRIRISIVVSIVACRGQDLRYFWLGLLLGRDVFLRSQKFQDNLYDFAGLFVGVADIFISWPWWMMLLPRGALRREGESPRPFDSSQFRQLFPDNATPGTVTRKNCFTTFC